MSGMQMNDDGGVGFSFAAVECGVKINDNGTFGVFFDSLEPMVLMAMVRPELVNLIMPQVWDEADKKGITLK
jgi:hypothetical protein